MCAACVAQGVGYVGASLAGLRVMAVRARRRQPTPDRDSGGPDDAPPEPAPAEAEPVTT